ncbi:hypothetical protein D477_009283 [Arthrobacter crystallopoietes BAB-32]|uniref:Dehydrogenase n=1 Tax=Arthrobacter crystallopoietes BAB-32 TaxID=1246476 RepID=N1UZJ4_9MICC|nr:hypothetical protein [Arthrobacter crystallopoietes]EMY34490.1 hypothetical protein D477_009283 [Arthrobacter crystallopoietes BAB-32]
MAIDPRVALQSFTSALEEHLAAASSRRGDNDPAVEAAFSSIMETFEAYEDALYDAYGEVTPLVIYDETEDEDGDDDDYDDVADPFDDDLEIEEK